jgi:hypothetical protein
VPTFEVKEPIEVDLRPVLLDLESRTGVAVAANRKGHELAIGGSDFEALLLLALRSSLIGGIGNTGLAPSYILPPRGLRK